MASFDALVNFLLFLADLAALAAIHRRPDRWVAWAVAWLNVGLVALLAAVGWTHDPFAAMRVVCWAAFAHGPVVLALAAARLGGPRAIAMVLAGLALAAVGVDAFLVEPHALQLERFTVRTRALREPLRVAVLSDLQTDHVGDYEARAFALATDQHPDLILLPGDFVQTERKDRRTQVAAFRALLPALRAPLGVWAVQGNIEPAVGWAAELFGGTDVHASETTTTASVGPITLTALTLNDSFDPGLVVARAAGFQLVVGHGPDYALSPNVDADLLIAGHTHGGQVQIPGFGPPLILSRVPRAWGGGGLTDLGGGRHLVVSRGVGMERGRAPRLRFACRPEIVVVDLIPADQGAKTEASAATRSATAGQ